MSAIQPSKSPWQFVEDSAAITGARPTETLAAAAAASAPSQSNPSEALGPPRRSFEGIPPLPMPSPELIKTTRTEVDSKTDPRSGNIWKCVAHHHIPWLEEGVVYEFKCDLSKEALEADRVAFPGQEPHSISYFSGFKEIFENYVSHNNWDLDEITRQNIAPFQVCGFGIERKLDGQITAGDTIYLPSVEILEKRFGLKVKMMDGIASNSEFIENFLSGNLTISLKEYTHDLLVHGKNIFVSDVYGRLSEETWGAVNKMYPTIKSQKESSDPDTKEAAKLAELLLAFWVDLFTAGALSDEKPEHEEYPLTCEALVETIMRFTKSPEADAWWKRVSNPPAGEIYQRRRCLAAMKKLGLLSE